MANIAFFQNRLGRTDGVSLEVDKWKMILTKELGHNVFFCSGNSDVQGNYVIPELYAAHDITEKILINASREFRDYKSEAEMEADIYNLADIIEVKLTKFIEDKKIDVLIPNNLCSGGFQPAAAIAFHRVIRKTGLPTIIHSHDFYFEGEWSKEVFPTCYVAKSIYNRYFPTNLPNVKHVVINKLSQQWLKENKNIEAVVVPNVFDFNQDEWKLDNFNSDFRKTIGLSENDLLFLQATRVLDRKGIELAIDFLAAIKNNPILVDRLMKTETALHGFFDNDARIVLVCAGIIETIGISSDYWDKLDEKAKLAGIELIYCGDIVQHSRSNDSNKKIYSLWDAYINADFVTYPSLWEGWGNQLIEAIFAKLPFVIFEYPVFISDIKKKGFLCTTLGNEFTINSESGLAEVKEETLKVAATKAVNTMANKEIRTSEVNHNFEVAKGNFSFEQLKQQIINLMQMKGD